MFNVCWACILKTTCLWGTDHILLVPRVVFLYKSVAVYLQWKQSWHQSWPTVLDGHHRPPVRPDFSGQWGGLLRQVSTVWKFQLFANMKMRHGNSTCLGTQESTFHRCRSHFGVIQLNIGMILWQRIYITHYTLIRLITTGNPHFSKCLLC